MEYTRGSSHPATADLVRADLAEVWTVDDPDSPKRSASVSCVSDMLDLEFIPTPAFRDSKLPKEDPLPAMLADVLELSPSLKRGRGKSHGTESASKPTSEATDEECPTINLRSHGNDTFIANADHSQVTSAVTRGNGRARRSRPVPGSHSPGQSHRFDLAQSKANRRNHRGRQAEETRSPDSSPSQGPLSQRQSKANSGPSSSTRKSTVTGLKQTKTLPVTVSSTQPKPKRRKDDHDWFELSDSTDSEAEPRPRKRRSKRPSAAGARATRARKPRNAPMPTRGSKKPASRRPSSTSTAAGKPAQADAAESSQQVFEPVSGPLQDEGRVSTSEDQTPNEQFGLGQSASPFRHEDIPQQHCFLEVSKRTPSAPTKLRSTTTSPGHEEVIVVSSESNDGGNAPGSSPSLFLEQDKEVIAASDGLDVAVMTHPETNPSRNRLAERSAHRVSLGFISPPSLQPRVLDDKAEVSQTHDCSSQLPTHIREAFLSDQLPKAASPSHPPELNKAPSKKERLDHEDVWEKAVENDTPPAILRRIVILLHRSLKPREEVVREIATDYQENGLHLLQNLTARHEKEKRETLAALQKASRAAISLFSGAGQDMALLIDRIRDMDVTHGAEALERPALANKLDVVAGLCQARLGNYTQAKSHGDDSLSDVDEMDGELDRLAASYRVRLLEAAREPHQHVVESYGTVHAQVEEFVRRCLRGENSKTQPGHGLRIAQHERPTRSADQALEVFLDRVIKNLQRHRSEGGFAKTEGGNLVGFASKGSGFAVANH